MDEEMTSDEEGQKMPNKFKKGVWNPKAKLVDLNTSLMSPSDEPIDYKSVKLNNKNLIRAAATGNTQLLKTLLSTKDFISSVFDIWGPESNYSLIEYFFKNQDKEGLETLLTALREKNPQEKIKFAYPPAVGLKRVTTGSNSIFAYGTRVRKVNMGRGGREYNNAFADDIELKQDLNEITMNNILRIDTNPELLGLMRAHNNNWQNEIDNRFA